MQYKYYEGQIVNYGKKKVTVEKLLEFWGTPSYRVCWFNKENEVERAHLREDEIS